VITRMEAAVVRRAVLLPVAFAMALFAAGCASGPVGSHGVDYIPAFDTPANR
jgi:hypothetical protein